MLYIRAMISQWAPNIVETGLYSFGAEASFSDAYHGEL